MVGWEKNRKLPVTKETNTLPWQPKNRVSQIDSAFLGLKSYVFECSLILDRDADMLITVETNMLL